MSEQRPGPCPFCKSEDVTIDYEYDEDWVLGWGNCESCGATGPSCETKDAAIAAWNAPGEKAAALVGALGAVTEEAADLQEYHGDALNRNAVPNARALLPTD